MPMKTHIKILFGLLTFIAIAAITPTLQVKADTPTPPEGEWAFLRWGIDWQKFHITSPRPNDIFVARLYRSETSATIDSAVPYGTIVSEGPQSVPDMTSAYQGVINYWGQSEPISQTMVPAWGGRNDVAVAINGYFFGPTHELPGVPWSGVVHSGWYDKRYTNNLGDAGFAWTSDRRAFIGSCVFHTGNGKNEATFSNTSYTPNLDGDQYRIRENEEFILYTPQYRLGYRHRGRCAGAAGRDEQPQPGTA